MAAVTFFVLLAITVRARRQINRKIYAIFLLQFFVGVTAVAMLIHWRVPHVVVTPAALFTLVIIFLWTVLRLNDLGWSRWWAWLWLFPAAGILLATVLCIRKGTAEDRLSPIDVESPPPISAPMSMEDFQPSSAGYGLVYWLLYLTRRWLLTLWSIGLALASPVGAGFMMPVVLAALAFDLRMTPQARDLRLGVSDLERVIAADTPLAVAFGEFGGIRPAWRYLWIFLYLTLVYAVIHAALLLATPAEFPRWGYMSFAIYTLAGSALSSICLAGYPASGIAKRKVFTFQQYAELLEYPVTYPKRYQPFARKVTVKGWGFFFFVAVFFVWLLTLGVAPSVYSEQGKDDLHMMVMAPFLCLMFNGLLPTAFWKYKLQLARRRIDPHGTKFGGSAGDSVLSQA